MLSLVAGKTVGVAKNIDPVVARLPSDSYSEDDWLTGLGMINDDMGAQAQLQAKFIVLLAAYYPPHAFPGNNQGWVNRCHVILEAMASKGAIVVTGSGNSDYGQQVDGWPANFGKRTNPANIPSLIVAGALTPEGGGPIYATDPLGGIPQVYAPGIRVRVAEGDPTNEELYRWSKGTSDCQCPRSAQEMSRL